MEIAVNVRGKTNRYLMFVNRLKNQLMIYSNN